MLLGVVVAVLGRASQFALPVLFQQGAAEGGTLEDRLYQVVLLQRLRQVLVHLCLDALFTVTHHRMRREGDNGRPLRSQAALVLADLARGFETTLSESTLVLCPTVKGESEESNHYGHLDVHENNIKLLLLDLFHGFETVANDGHHVVVLLENLDSKPLVDTVVLG